jgi:hypothetical protein
MHESIPEAFDFVAEEGEYIKILFRENYELRIIAHPIRPFRRHEIRNVQLFHNGLRIAQYDGVIDYSSRRDPHAEVFHPHARILGDASEIAAFWESALSFIDTKYRLNKKQPANENYNRDIVQAMTVASSSERDLKMLKRQTDRERHDNERTN